MAKIEQIKRKIIGDSAEVVAAEIDYKIATEQLTRGKQLFNQGIITLVEFERRTAQSNKALAVLTEKQQKIQEKLESFQELYDSNQKMLSYGRKMNELLHKYFQTNNKKQLTTAFNDWLVIEKTKHLKKNPPKPKTKIEKKQLIVEKKKVEEKLKVVEKEVLVAVEKVREEKIKVDKVIAKQKADYVFKINDKVRIIDSNTVGTIDKIEKNNAFINYGVFTTKTTIQKLELVQSSKK